MTDVLFSADVSHSTNEVRFHAFGRIDGEVFAAVVTFRGQRRSGDQLAASEPT